jgi:hypothetical protein
MAEIYSAGSQRGRRMSKREYIALIKAMRESYVRGERISSMSDLYQQHERSSADTYLDTEISNLASRDT